MNNLNKLIEIFDTNIKTMSIIAKTNKDYSKICFISEITQQEI